MRQPGSAWKLFVYLAALEAGYKPDDKVVDEPVTIDGWSPHNSGGSYAGKIDVRTAFASSKNTVAAELGQQVGFRRFTRLAHKLANGNGASCGITILDDMHDGAPDYGGVGQSLHRSHLGRARMPCRVSWGTRASNVAGGRMERACPNMPQALGRISRE